MQFPRFGDGGNRWLLLGGLLLVLALAPCAAIRAAVPVSGSVNTASIVRTIPDNGLALHSSVYSDQFSNNFASGNSTLDDRLIEAGVELLRYPGGSYSDLFHFSIPPTSPYYTCCSSLPDTSQPHPMTPYPGMDPTGPAYPYGYHHPNSHFGNFVKLLDATGTNAMITVNYGSSLGNLDGSNVWRTTKGGQPQEAAAWVAYANADPAIYGTEDDVDLGVDAEGIDWKTAGYWARLRASTPAEYDTWAQADGVHDAANRFLAIDRDAAVGIKYWEIGNEINGNGYYGSPGWEADYHAPYGINRQNNTALRPQTYGANLIQFSQLMKQVDPTIQIGAVMVGNAPGAVGNTNISGSNSTNWDRRVLETAGSATVTVGGQQYNAMDFGILHWYVDNEPDVNWNQTCDGDIAICEANVLSATAAQLPGIYQTLRNRVDTYTNRDGASFPIHMTEFGYFDSIGSNNLVTGLFAADVYATALELGAETVHFLEMSSLFLTGGTNPSPRPAFRAFQMLDQFMNPGDEMLDTTSGSPNLKLYAVRRPDGTVAVMMVNLASGDANDAEVSLSIPGADLSQDGTRWIWGSGQSGAPLESAISGLGNDFTITVPDRTVMVLLIPEAPVLAGDYNGDGRVDAGDYVRWRNALAGLATLENETVTKGVVDEFDYAEWKANYGQPSGGGSLAVPEPSALVLLILAGLLGWARKNPPIG